MIVATDLNRLHDSKGIREIYSKIQCGVVCDLHPSNNSLLGRIFVCYQMMRHYEGSKIVRRWAMPIWNTNSIQNNLQGLRKSGERLEVYLCATVFSKLDFAEAQQLGAASRRWCKDSTPRYRVYLSS
jgi:hypothetical protein